MLHWARAAYGAGRGATRGATRVHGACAARFMHTARTLPAHRYAAAAAAAAAATAAAGLSVAGMAKTALADAPAEAELPPTQHTLPFGEVFAWGSNKTRVVAPGSAAANVTVPTAIPELTGTFRDMQLAATHGAAVDARGDVLQWGDGHAQGPGAPQRTLTGHDIARVQLTADKVYALARNGTIYVIPASAAAQKRTSGILGASVQATALVCSGASERFVDIAAGEHHLIALSRNGRVWSVPVDAQANEYGQLGVSAVTLDTPQGKCEAQMLPKIARGEPVPSATSTTLRPVPALRDVEIAQIAAGSEHSLARTPDGRVVAWGRNSVGQLGLGPSILSETVAVPTEVLWPQSLVGRMARCEQIAAGGANSLFVVHGNGAPRSSDDDDDGSGGDTAAARRLQLPPSRVDVLASGSGTRGTLGNGQRPQVAGTPVRVKSVSGLYEFSEQARGLVPIGIHQVAVGNGQCAAVLAEPVADHESRRDVYVWGANDAYQLGTGRKGNVAVPVLLTLGGDAREKRDSPVMNRLLLLEHRGATLFGGSVAQAIAVGCSGIAIYTRA